MAKRKKSKPRVEAIPTPAEPNGAPPLHPAMQYARDVAAGRITACRFVRLAVKRHLADRATAHERGLYFDEAAAVRAVKFIETFCHHSKGEWAGRLLQLEPWQQFIVACVFGWKRASDGLRRFRTVYEEVARKNGKSSILAAVGNYLLLADNEPGAEVYSVATKHDQAVIIHSEAVRMVRASPSLASRVRIQRNNLSIDATNSKFEPLGADEDTLDGLNVHGALVDELHAHKTRGVVDVMETATGARRQPLQWYITTAGFDRNSICWELRDYAVKILEGDLENDSWFGIIYTLDVDERDPAKGDDWADERNWVKANPNLGVSVKLDDLRQKAAKAKALPTALNNFLRKHMDLWTSAEHKWANMGKWRSAPPLDPALLTGDCIGAFDLSIRRDLCAWVRIWRLAGGAYAARWHFWMPEAGLEEKERADRAPYATWAREGYITLVPGDTMDYDLIRQHILADSAQCVIREITFDVANAVQLYNDLAGDGFTLVEYRQGMLSMSPPTKTFDELVAAGKFLHGGNPVAAWMLSNAVAVTDSGGNVKLTKDPKASKGRIDGIIAAIMALGRWQADPDQGSRSMYETQGLAQV